MQVVESLRGCKPCGRTQVIRLMVAVRFVSLGVLIDGGRARVESEETVVIRTRSVMARRPLTIFAGWVATLDVPGMLLISVRRCAEYFNVGAGRSVKRFTCMQASLGTRFEFWLASANTLLDKCSSRSDVYPTGSCLQ